MSVTVEEFAAQAGLSVAEAKHFLENPDYYEKQFAEMHLREFIPYAWPFIEPAPFQPNWHIDAIAEHLEAVSRGHIKRLLINVPPRSTKTTTTAACWPAWTWAQERKRAFRLLGPQVRWVFASYGDDLATDGSVLCRRLIQSEWYQKNWGDRYKLAWDQDTKHKFDNDKGGARLCTSIEAGVTGRGGDIFVIDDPHNTKQVESDVERVKPITWWRQTVQSRLNDPRSGAFVVIMQRLHNEDLSGYLLEQSRANWTHLCLPMEYESERHCVTVVLPGSNEVWEDPRKIEGELMQPDRFDAEWCKATSVEAGPYVWAGQYQQRPQPQGGGILQRAWWQLWHEEKYPAFDLILGSVDTAYTEKTENDWSAFTLWGVYRNADDLPQVMLIYAWRDRLAIHELCQKIGTTMKKYKATKLLIEAKASGISVYQEMRRLFGDDAWSCEMRNPGNQDKVARAISVQSLFAPTTNVARDRNGKVIDTTETLGIVWAPDKTWADAVIDECAAFNKGKHDDYVDSTVQALMYLRAIGWAKRRQEHQTEMLRKQTQYQQQEPLYEVT